MNRMILIIFVIISMGLFAETSEDIKYVKQIKKTILSSEDEKKVVNLLEETKNNSNFDKEIYELGDLFFEERNYEVSEKIYKNLVRRSGEYYNRAIIKLGLTYYQMKEYLKASAIFDTIENGIDNSKKTYLNILLADSNKRIGDYENVEKYLLESVEIFSKSEIYKESLFMIAKFYAGKEDGKAEKYIKKMEDENIFVIECLKMKYRIIKKFKDKEIIEAFLKKIEKYRFEQSVIDEILEDLNYKREIQLEENIINLCINSLNEKNKYSSIFNENKDEYIEKIFCPMPKYPSEAEQKNLEGKIRVLISIDENSNVVKIEFMEKSEYEILNKAVEETVKNWKIGIYKNGTRVKGKVQNTINFKLKNK